MVNPALRILFMLPSEKKKNQDVWERCEDWIEGQVETGCPTFHENAPLATGELDSKGEEY